MESEETQDSIFHLSIHHDAPEPTQYGEVCTGQNSELSWYIVSI